MRKTSKLEKNRLRDLIKEYSSLGYEVFAEYKDFQKPEAIGNFTPDLIVKKGDQTIVIEIATKSKLPSLSEKMKQLSQYADENKNVRFDIVLTNPRPRLSRQEKSVSNEVLLSDMQERLFVDSMKLYDNGYYESSYLLLSTLFENILRKFAIKNRVISIHEQVPIMDLTYLLLDKERISKDNFAAIKRYVEYRNKVIHESYRLDKQIVQEYISFVSYFIKKVSPKILTRPKKTSKTATLSDYLARENK